MHPCARRGAREPIVVEAVGHREWHAEPPAGDARRDHTGQVEPPEHGASGQRAPVAEPHERGGEPRMPGGPGDDASARRQLAVVGEVSQRFPAVAEVANLVERARIRAQITIDEACVLSDLGEGAEASADLREQAENHVPAPLRARATTRNPIDSSGWRSPAARFQWTRRAYGARASPPTMSIRPASGVSYTTGMIGSVGSKPPVASSASKLSRLYSTL